MTITAECIGIPEKDEYDVTYQWQYSHNGTSWYDIEGANSSTFTVRSEDISGYYRVVVSAIQYGNVVYPSVFYSDATTCKVVLLGDVNLDGVVNISDATQIQKYIVGSATFTTEQMIAADVNKDGIVNITDATLVQSTL